MIRFLIIHSATAADPVSAVAGAVSAVAGAAGTAAVPVSGVINNVISAVSTGAENNEGKKAGECSTVCNGTGVKAYTKDEYESGDYANTSVIVGRTMKRHCASLFGQNKCSCVEDKLCVKTKMCTCDVSSAIGAAIAIGAECPVDGSPKCICPEIFPDQGGYCYRPIHVSNFALILVGVSVLCILLVIACILWCRRSKGEEPGVQPPVLNEAVLQQIASQRLSNNHRVRRMTDEGKRRSSYQN